MLEPRAFRQATMMGSELFRRFCRRSTIPALAALLFSATGASADIIRKEDMLRGITVTRARCDAIQDTVWVNVYGRDFCVRYYLSTAGGEGLRPVVFMQGDYFGNIRAGRWADPSSGKDIDTDNLRRTADKFSRMTKTTAIYLARIGVDGTSGNHLWRKTVLELQLMNASLDAIKQRHGFQGFHLVGQSGGSKLLVGLTEMRRDVACAVAGSGPLDNPRRKSNSGDPGRTYFDVVENMAPLLQNRAVRVMLVTDPVDKTVPLAEQAGFAEKMRRAGRPVAQFMVQATDEHHHGVVDYARLVAAGCVLGKTDAEITSAVSTLVRRNAEYNERRKREISAQPGIATAAAGEQAIVR
jgi:hypothetical protein